MAATTASPPDPLAPESVLGPDGGSDERPGTPRLLRLLTAVLALAFFAIPLTGAVLGRGGGPITGERAAVAPRPSQGWDAFPNATGYLTQHLPGRGRAVKANTFIAERILGSTPSYAGGPGRDRALPFGGPGGTPGGTGAGAAAATVLPWFRGLDGWTYLQDDLFKACRPPAPLPVTLGRWLSLVSAIRASGRRVVWVVVPEKSTIYPEHLGTRGVDLACAQRSKARLWSRLESLHDPGVLPLRAPLLAAKRGSNRPIYLPINTHWNDLGAFKALGELLGRLGGGVRASLSELRLGTSRYTSDLSIFTGKTETASTPTLAIVRAGDDAVHASSTTAASGARLTVTTHAGGRVRVVGGRTLLIRDSFGDALVPMLRHYVGRMVDATWKGQPPSDLVPLMRGADTVILLTVERSFWTLPSTKIKQSEAGSVVTAPFVEAVRRGLPPRR